MRFVLINNGETSQDKLKRMLVKHGSYIVMPADDMNPSIIHPDDVIILNSGPGNVYEKNRFTNQVKLLRTHPGKIIGICLGMQLISKTFGSSVVKRERRLNNRRIAIYPFGDNSVIVEPVKVWENRYWAVHTVPKGFEVLANSNSDIEIIKHKSKPIWGMLFHPEYSGKIGEHIFNEILKQ